MEHFDVLIVGAGLSGVGAACHLERHCPDRRYVILESRDDMGGTWDLFRYPGIRSDSDMHTLGYNFKPWIAAEAIADGPAILDYIHQAARENGIEAHIRYGHRVVSLDWSSTACRWTVTVQGDAGAASVTITANFIMMCAGYYSYRQGYRPEFAGIESFRGDVVDPQFWPEDLDYRDKRVVVIGSGATAMTLVPAMAGQVRHITMLQRSPTYVVSRPDRDRIANTLRRVLPARWAYALTRWKNVLLQQVFYHRTRVAPERVKQLLLDRVRAALGDVCDVDTHFTPCYNPWDQRLCLIPNGDLFDAIRSGKASVVTAEIERFEGDGLLLKSGQRLPADMVVTATGLEMATMGEAVVRVDGQPVHPADTWSYKGAMYSDVPNLISTFGYINASWTLRADLIAEFACRLLNHMNSTGTNTVVPRLRPGDAGMPARHWIEDFSPGYIRRAVDRLPKQGDREPWINPQNYRKDRGMFRHGPLEDGVLQFSAGGEAPSYSEAEVRLAGVAE